LNTAFIILPDFILILVAWGICRYTILNQSIWEPLEQLVYWLLFPCLLFSSALTAKLNFSNYIPMFLLLAFCMCAMGLLSYCAKWLFRPDPINLISGIQTTIRFNTVLILAVASRIFDQPALEMMVITIALMVPFSNALSIYSLARGYGQNVLPQLIKNPFVIATTLGLLCNFFQIQLPDVLTMNIRRIGMTSIPLGLMTVGASLKWTETKKDTALVMYWATLKLMVFPTFAFVGATLLHLPEAQKQNAVLFACMPTATSAYVLTNRMGGNGAIVAITISIMTLLATLTIPLWLYLLQVFS
jgi:predicted permease